MKLHSELLRTRQPGLLTAAKKETIAEPRFASACWHLDGSGKAGVLSDVWHRAGGASPIHPIGRLPLSPRAKLANPYAPMPRSPSIRLSPLAGSPWIVAGKFVAKRLGEFSQHQSASASGHPCRDDFGARHRACTALYYPATLALGSVGR